MALLQWAGCLRVPAAAAPLLILPLTAQAAVGVRISSEPTNHMVCSAGVCTPTRPRANLNRVDLATMLAASDVKIVSNNKSPDIIVAEGFTWGTANRLTLDSYHAIRVNSAVTVAGPGALTLTTNDGGAGGDLLFTGSANIEFWELGSSLVVNGNAYKLVNTIQRLAQEIGKDPFGFFALSGNYSAAHDGAYANAPVSTTFNGTFEGLGNTISKFKIEDASDNDNVGLFSLMGGEGIVRDLQISGASVVSSGSSTTAGALVGYLAGRIQSVRVRGTRVSAVNSLDDAGLVAGFSSAAAGAGVITDTSVAGSVDGYSAGGVVGFVDNGFIENCQSTAEVRTSSNSAGGLVGIFHATDDNQRISNSYASGPVTGGGPTAAIGGLVGINYGSILSSFATGAITGDDGTAAGGLVGDQAGPGLIKNDYATGEVTGGSSVSIGGLTGRQEGKIHASYAIGPVSGGSGSGVGGFVGKVFDGMNAKDYWDTETSGTTQGAGDGNNAGLTGLTTVQLQSGLPDGFDPSVWGQKSNVNNGLPYLLANPPPK